MKKLCSVLLMILLSATFVFAKKDLSKEIDAATKKIMPQVIKWRRHIHENPELSNREFKTAKMVADHMRGLGFEVKTGIAKTGVIGILKGAMPGPTIGLRADMDALPVKERVDIPFASKVVADYQGIQTPRDARLRARHPRGNADGNGGSSRRNEGQN